MKPQKKIQFGKPPMPQEMHVPTATKTERQEITVTMTFCSLNSVSFQVGVCVSTCGDGIAAMIKELSEGRAAVGPAGLFPINSIKRLIDEEAQRIQDEGP